MTTYTKIRSDTQFLQDIQYGSRNTDKQRPSAYVRDVAYGNAYQYPVTARAIMSSRPSMKVDVGNALVKRFQNQLGEHSSFGATLTAELNSTVETVAGIVLRAVKAARQIRKLDFGGAASTLGLPYRERTITKTRFRKRRKPSREGSDFRERAYVSRHRVFSLPNGREVSKTLANGWLLYSYGLAPLMGDIHNALETIVRPLEYKEKVVASASTTKVQSEMTASGSGNKYYFYSFKLSCTLKGRCGAIVSVVNPNFRILSQMGLTNPVQWVNEAIPFSFVADWFSNLSDVIAGFSAYEGLKLENPWTSYKSLFDRVIVDISPYGSYTKPISGVSLERFLTIPTTTFKVKYERFQPQRALNAISLLVGFLPRR